jgi:hypothetical protein
VNKTTFQPGDRVAFYHAGERRTGIIVKGNIREHPIPEGAFWVEWDNGLGGSTLVHPKQCRKLKERRVWIPRDAFTDAKKCGADRILADQAGPWVVKLKQPGDGDWVEFIEVKK